jgi:hypothetical protein
MRLVNVVHRRFGADIEISQISAVRRYRSCTDFPKADQPEVRVGSKARVLLPLVQEQPSERNDLNERRLSGTASSARTAGTGA